MKTKIKRSYYRLDFQIVISVVVILATLFSFLSLFITLLNSLKGQEEIISNIFAFPRTKPSCRTFLTRGRR